MGSFVAMFLRLLEVVKIGTMAMSTILSTTVMVVGTPEKDQCLLSYGRDYIKVSDNIFTAVMPAWRSSRAVTMQRMKILQLERIHYFR
jgi:hypothetical protein